MKILSFDIECAAQCPDKFPDPSTDPIIQIACITKVEGSSQSSKTCFAVGTCVKFDDVNLVVVSDEKELLIKWAEFVQFVDPDVLVGYNIIKFDLLYIFKRSQIGGYVHVLGNSVCRFQDIPAESYKGKRHMRAVVEIKGRVVQILFQSISLSSYTLNNVAQHFLGH
uniref:DNA-directed DNA polymerase family B exonuclease domain-containing protein n=1 Tax=Panagrolaimus sp. ES5 TaxID=591445 RepID=A0AC34G9C5_9BILA